MCLRAHGKDLRTTQQPLNVIGLYAVVRIIDFYNRTLLESAQWISNYYSCLPAIIIVKPTNHRLHPIRCGINIIHEMAIVVTIVVSIGTR